MYDDPYWKPKIRELLKLRKKANKAQTMYLEEPVKKKVRKDID